jgi:chromosome segregation ATPase
LIPVLAREFKPNNLPLFLRQLQVGKINDPQFIEEIIPILGGTNIEKLQHEILSLREQLDLISIENESLRRNSEAESNKVTALAQQNTEAKEVIKKLSAENILLKEQVAKLANESDLLNKTVQEQNQLLSRENLSLKAQITSLINEGNMANKISKKRESSLSSENTSLKEQVAKLAKENNTLNQKLTEQENSLSGNNTVLREQVDEFKKEIDSRPKSSPTIKKNNRPDQPSSIIHPRPERIRELLNELDKQEAYLRMEAVQELSNIEFPLQDSQRSLVIQRIENLASSDPNSEVRTAAALALLSFRGKSK